MNKLEFHEEKPQNEMNKDTPIPDEPKTPSSEIEEENQTDDFQVPPQSAHSNNSGRALDEDSSKSDEVNITSENLKLSEEKTFLFKTKQLRNKVLLFCHNCFLNNIELKIFCGLITSAVLYAIGLLPCYDMTKCFWGLGLRIFIFAAILTLVSAFLVSLYFFYVFLTKKHFIHMAYIIPIYLIFFLTFQGTSNINHGGYNMMVFVLCLVGISLLMLLLFLVYYSFKNKTFIILTIFVICFVSFIWLILFSNWIFNFSCESWDKGLNNTYPDNSEEYPCIMKKPPKNTCYLDAFDNAFDFSVWFGYTGCNIPKLRDTEFEEFIQFLPKSMRNRTRYGYPITARKTFPFQLTKVFGDFQQAIYNNIIDMDEYESGTNETLSALPKPEMQVTFNKKTGRGKVEINIERNETLAKERKKIEEELKNEDETGPYQNVLLLYLDGISRPNFFRKLKKHLNI